MSREAPVLPGAFINLLMDTVARWDITPEHMLEGSSITLDSLQKPFWYVDFLEFNRLLSRAIVLTKEPGIGIHLGMQMTITCLGVIGFAAMVAKNIYEAIEVSGQFLQMRCPAIRMNLEIESGMAYLKIEQPLPEYQLQEAGLTCLLVGIGQMGQALTGQKMTGIGEVRFPEPDYFNRLSHLLGSGICFEQSHNRLVFPASYLDKVLIMADPQAARLAREQCKRALGEVSGSRNCCSRLTRDLVFDEVLGFSNIDDIAQKLNISRRTLQRQLSSEGTSFGEIIETIRQEKAVQLLRQNQLSIAAIAEYLSYTDTANFNRAFKRWKRQSASQYRMQAQKNHNL
jgi:AraC-like DNA-binding protein